MIPTGAKSTWYAQAKQVIDQGYPAVAPLLPDLVAWLQDINWPGAGNIATFLATIGEPVLPYVQDVLRGTDRTWQYVVIHQLVDKLPSTLVALLEPELRQLASYVDGEEVDIAALKQLAKHHIGDSHFIRNSIAQKRKTYQMILEELEIIELYLPLQ